MSRMSIVLNSVDCLNSLFYGNLCMNFSAVFSGGAGCARAPPEFWGSEKGRSLISAYRSLAITTNTPGFKKLYTALMIGTFVAIAFVTKSQGKYH